MLTIKLYDEKPYDREFTAEVRAVETTEDGKSRIELERTLFFPEEGGQTSDTGFINGIRTVHVSIENGTIWHETDGPADIKTGDEVRCSIDWGHRFSNMQNHTGEHILSGLLHRDWGSENVGFHLSDNIVTLDTSKALEEADIDELERMANEVIYMDIPVQCRYFSPDEAADIEYRSKKEFDEDIRIVTIPGIDVCACCAPHVARTGEIGIIRIIHAIKYKGGMRLTILSGRRALEYTRTQHKTVETLSHMLSENPDTLPDAVMRLMKEIEGYKLEKKEADKKRLEAAVKDALASGSGIIFTGDTDNVTQRRTVNDLAESMNVVCAVFAGDDRKGYKYIIACPGGDARDAAALLKERFNAKGGGTKEMVQGSINGSESEIRMALNSYDLHAPNKL